MSNGREAPPESPDPTLRHRAVDGAIVGFRCPDQIDPILAGGKLELSDEDLEQINGGAR